MKKTIVALAAFAASGAVLAQSSVTLFGVLDAGVGYLSSTGGGHTVGLLSGGNTTSRLGFRGSEDLGGGLAASFWLEGQLNNDNGAGATQTTGLDFQRRSTVSLSGNFGEIRMGRDWAATYLPLLALDPYGGRGLGSFEQLGTGAGGMAGLSLLRVSNSVAYFLPARFGGLTGNIQYSFGERNSATAPIANAAGISSSAANATTDKTGNYYGARLAYAQGPIEVSGSYGRYQDAVRTVGASSYADDYQVANFGGSYNFGVIKPVALFQQERIDGRGAVSAFRMNSYFFGLTAPIGAGLIRAEISRYDNRANGNDANKAVIGYVYNLSKRTAVYADISRINNQGAGVFNYTALSASVPLVPSAPGGNASGFAFGVKHAF